MITRRSVLTTPLFEIAMRNAASVRTSFRSLRKLGGQPRSSGQAHDFLGRNVRFFAVAKLNIGMLREHWGRAMVCCEDVERILRTRMKNPTISTLALAPASVASKNTEIGGTHGNHREFHHLRHR